MFKVKLYVFCFLLKQVQDLKKKIAPAVPKVSFFSSYLKEVTAV